MIVRLFSFLKKPNSTKVPTAAGMEFKCTLKSDTSIINPVIILDGWLTGYNYAYIPDFNRYYYIDDITLSNKLTIITMSVDVLASYKNAIGISSQYVSRSASDYDTDIVDTKYPTKPETKIIVKTAPNPFAAINGCYVVQYSGADGIRAVAMTIQSFQTVVADLWASLTDMPDISGIPSQAAKQLMDPFQYILDVKYFPCLPGQVGTTSVSSIQLGDYVIEGITGFSIANNQPPKSVGVINGIEIPKHPQASTLHYLKSGNYSKYAIFLPGAGYIDLTAEDIYNNDRLYAQCFIDGLGGAGYWEIATDSLFKNVIKSVSCQVGVPWAITNRSSDIFGVAGGVLNAGASLIGGLVTGGVFGLGGGLVGAASGIASAAQALFPTATTKGSVNGLGTLFIIPEIQLKYQELCEEDIVQIGRPLMQVKVINTLSGYLECDHADIETTGTAEENTMIVSYMNGGFYYE